MGFAAMETAGYGFEQFLDGGLSSMTAVLVLRMVLAGFGHGVWTAIIGAAIWRDRGAATFKLTRGVALACGIAVTLHALWDASPWFEPVSAILGLLVLRFLIGESVSRARLGPAAPAPEPLEQALRAYFRHLFHWGKHAHGTGAATEGRGTSTASTDLLSLATPRVLGTVLLTLLALLLVHAIRSP
jgi:hypothetical protein